MYKVLKDNKIVGVVGGWSETDKKCHPDLIVEEDVEHTIDDYIEVDGEYVLTTDTKVKEKKAKERIEELEQYLKDTDWYAIRKADNDEEMPEDIKTARQDARDEISRLRGE